MTKKPASISLQNRRILITRPFAQAQALGDAISQAGGIPLCFPTLIILEPSDPNVLLQATQNLAQYDLAIFISPTAVRQSLAILKKYWPILPSHLKFAAVGLGTTRALTNAGIEVSWYPKKDFGSKGLLALPALQQVAGLHIAIFQGEGGSNVLAPCLRERGAKVDTVFAYRRTAPTGLALTPLLDTWQTLGIDAIVSTSIESLKNLWEIMGKFNQTLLLNTPLFVISQAMFNYAKSLGFQTILQADSAIDQAIVSALSKWSFKD